MYRLPCPAPRTGRSRKHRGRLEMGWRWMPWFRAPLSHCTDKEPPGPSELTQHQGDIGGYICCSPDVFKMKEQLKWPSYFGRLSAVLIKLYVYLPGPSNPIYLKGTSIYWTEMKHLSTQRFVPEHSWQLDHNHSNWKQLKCPSTGAGCGTSRQQNSTQQ